jgi:hypothetical protein
MLIDLEAKDPGRGCSLHPQRHDRRCRQWGGKEREVTLEIRSLTNAKIAHPKKGKVAYLCLKSNRVRRGE